MLGVLWNKFCINLALKYTWNIYIYSFLSLILIKNTKKINFYFLTYKLRHRDKFSDDLALS